MPNHTEKEPTMFKKKPTQYQDKITINQGFVDVEMIIIWRTLRRWKMERKYDYKSREKNTWLLLDGSQIITRPPI